MVVGCPCIDAASLLAAVSWGASRTCSFRNVRTPTTLPYAALLSLPFSVCHVASTQTNHPHHQILDIEPPITWALLGVLVMGTAVVLFNHFAMGVTWCARCLPPLVIIRQRGIKSRPTRAQVLHCDCRATVVLHGDGGLPLQGRDRFLPHWCHGQDSTAGDWIHGPCERNLKHHCRSSNGWSSRCVGFITPPFPFLLPGLTFYTPSSSTDLLTDLKTGYLLGANVRLQVLAQCLGMVSSVVLTVPLYYVLIPDASVIGSDAVCTCTCTLSSSEDTHPDTSSARPVACACRLLVVFHCLGHAERLLIAIPCGVCLRCATTANADTNSYTSCPSRELA